MSLLKKGGAKGTPDAPGGARLVQPPTAPPLVRGTSAVSGRPRAHTGGAGGHGTRQELPAGTVLQERYLVEAVQGIGGMSVVYRGRDLRFKDVVRTCAIKEMFQNAPNSQTSLMRLKNFEREAGLLATLSHPAIPKVFDYFEENGKAYLIMELIAGQDLEALIDDQAGPLEPNQVASWALEICDVLAYLHGHEPEPIIFRDLKPSNIIATTLNHLVLIDFGIARNFLQNQRKGTLIGTEGYAAPEQYRGVVDPRGDLYALGATLHHLLTGVDPRVETPFTFHERPVQQFNPEVSPEFEAIVMHLLEYDPEQRPQTIGEVKDALLAMPESGDSHPVERPVVRKAVPATARGATTQVVWKFACEDEVRSSPHVRDGLLYIGSYDSNLYCLDAGSGEYRWKRPTQGGISSSATTWGDLVIVGSEDQHIYALDARRGTPKWMFHTGRAVRSSPRVEDRIIYCGSDDQHVYAIDGQNGRLLWKYRTWAPVRSSAAVKQGRVAIGSSDGQIYCLDAFNGTLCWKHKTQQGIISAPIIDHGLIFVGSMDGYIYACDIEGGSPVWRVKTGHYVNAGPTLVGQRLYVGSVDGTLYALESKTGKIIWKYETGSQIISTARINAGRLYFGAADHQVYCLDTATGALIWKFPTNGPVVSSPAIHENIVYIGSLDHYVYALQG